MKSNKLAISIALLAACGAIQADIRLPKNFKWAGFFVVEDVSNFDGGIKDGSVINAIYHPILSYDLKTKYNSQLQFGFLGITYTKNQQLYTGSNQNVSNLSAQRELRIAELNYFQEINSWADIRVGIMDLRGYLNIYDLPKELINSGFGTNRVMRNSAVATYPYPGFGTVVNLKQKNYGLGLAMFQGDPQHQKTLFHHGVFFLEEAYWNTVLPIYRQPELFLKVGFWQYQQPDRSIGYSNIGMYLMAQTVWFNVHGRQFNAYAQAGYGPNKANELPYSVMAGIAMRGLVPERQKDFLSFGISQIWLREAKNEVVFELGYKFVFMKDFELKPDLQYIVHPNGTLPNAFAGILRFVYNISGRLLQEH